jgi:hypothetical protein
LVLFALLLATTQFALPSLASIAQPDQPDSRTFPETGKVLRGKFLAYWETNGGLAQQGYPISDELQEKSDTDGKVYTVQYFERAVFELHRENAAPNYVLLSLLGVFRYKQQYPKGAPDQQPNNSAGSVLFSETGKRVGGPFLQYWNANGGLAQQGLPISDEFMEKSGLDGKTYRVQYFERAVFEYHPEKAPQYNVLLSQLGTFRYQAKYGGSPDQAAPQSTPLPSERSDAVGATTQWTASPAVGLLKSGQTQALSALIDDADAATFTLKQSDSSSLLTFTLRDPQGREITPSSVSAVYDDSTYAPGPQGATYSISRPAPGAWQIMVKADKVPAEGEAFCVGGEFTGGVQIAPQANPKRANAGHKVTLSATVRDSAPIVGAVVTATVVLPLDGPYPTSVRLTEQKGGVYSGEFTPGKEDQYSISFEVSGHNPQGHDFDRSNMLLLEVK